MVQSAVLFDLDGVLVDSRAVVADCINHALSRHGLPRRPAGALHQYVGPPLVHAFADLTGESPDSALVADCVTCFRARYANAFLRETVLVDGISGVLEELCARHRLAVATSKPGSTDRPRRMT